MATLDLLLLKNVAITGLRIVNFTLNCLAFSENCQKTTEGFLLKQPVHVKLLQNKVTKCECSTSLCGCLNRTNVCACCDSCGKHLHTAVSSSNTTDNLHSSNANTTATYLHAFYSHAHNGL